MHIIGRLQIFYCKLEKYGASADQHTFCLKTFYLFTIGYFNLETFYDTLHISIPVSETGCFYNVF